MPRFLDNIFRLVHTIKGTCGFLGLPRLEALAHAGETLMGKFRDGMPVTAGAVTLILSSIDRIKEIFAGLEATETEPEGTDEDLIEKLHEMAEGKHAEVAVEAAPVVEAPPVAPAAPAVAQGTLVEQVLERQLRPGEVSLDDLERAFRETEIEVAPAAPVAAPAPVAKAAAPAVAPEAAPEPRAAKEPKAKSKKAAAVETADVQEADKIANQSIRVNVDTLEHLMTMVSELVLTRNQLLEISRRNEDTEFKVPLQRLSNVTAELQEGVMKTRMQPIGNAWQKLPRIVRDLSGELGKQIELEMHGADTELDRQVLDLIKDPLTHMVRNSADHGLETPAERSAAGKPEQGTIRLSAYHEGGHIIICIADNGRGLNTERIKAKAVQNGLVSEADLEKMTEAQIHKFIFAPGFSTAAAVTSVSGRGVGMDVVRTNIDQIGGTIDIKSVAGEGSSVTIKIPLTLAIVSALIVEAGGDRFAIPQLAVVELVRARANSEHRIERIKDTAVLRLRNKLLPLMHLKKLLKIDDGSSSDPENGFIVVTQVGSQTFGIVVDGVFHTEEIVVKPMSTKLRHIDMFSGNTILGDGAVIMIIDPNGIAKALGAAGSASRELADDHAAAQASTGEQLTSLLVFRAGSNQPKAVPLGLVTRLEEIATDKIELSNGRYMVQYREQLMPLVQMDGVTRPDLRLAADPGVCRRRPLDGPGGRRDHRHRRGASAHRGGGLAVRHSGFGRDQGPGHRSDRRRPLPPDGVRRLVLAQGDAARRSPRSRCCWSTIQRVLPQHAGAGAEGRGLSGAGCPQRPGRPHRAAFGPDLRRGADRHRNARHERVRVRRDSSAPTSIWPRCRSSRCRRWCRRRRSSAAGRPASTTTSPSSTVRA